MLRHKIFVFFMIIMITISSALSMIGKADSGSLTQIDELKENIEINEINFTENSRKITVKSVRSYGDEEIFFQFKIKAENTLYLEVSSGKNKDGSSLEHELKLDFIGIIEFIDQDSNTRYDPKTDPVESIYPLSNKIYSSDIVKDMIIVDDKDFFEVTKEQLDVVLLEKFYFGYDMGYESGFNSGSEEGEFDKNNNLTFNNNYFYHISFKELGLIKNMKINEDDVVRNVTFINFTYKEMIDLIDKGFYTGFGAGFKAGYGEGYGLPGNAQTKGDTRKSNNFWSSFDIKLFERPEFWLPRYKPMVMNQYKSEKSGTEIGLEIEDIRGTFNIICTIADHFVDIENGYLSPSSIKFNLNIDNYPFESNNSNLALLADLNVKSRGTGNITMNRMTDSYAESLGFAYDEMELRVNSNNFTGFFSWIDHIYCDGERKNINVEGYSSYSTSFDFSNTGSSFSSVYNLFNLILTYPRCNKISHDPILGITRINQVNLYKGDEVILDEQVVPKKIQIDWNIVTFLATSALVISFVLVSRIIRRKY